MDRISLTRGLADPAAKEPVEIFVPDGEVVTGTVPAPGIQWQGTVIWDLVTAVPGSLTTESSEAISPVDRARLMTALRELRNLPGLARTFRESSGRNSLAFLRLPVPEGLQEGYADLGAYMRLDIDGDPFAAIQGQSLPAAVEVRDGKYERGEAARDGSMLRASGAMEIVEAQTGVDSAFVRARIKLDMQVTNFHLSNPAESRSGTAAFQLELARRREATRATLAFPAKPDLHASWQVSWTQPPRTGLLDILPEEGGLPEGVHPAALSEIPPLATDDPVRIAASKALDEIGAATRDEVFAQRARQALFGQAVPVATSEIRAWHDFVMFRRRRRVTCLQPPPVREPTPRNPDPVEPKPQAADRLHRVFAIPSSASQKLRELAERTVQGETDFLARLESAALASAIVAFKNGGTEFDESVLQPVADTGLGTGAPLALVAVDRANPDLAFEGHSRIAETLGFPRAEELRKLQLADFGEGIFEASVFVQRRG